MKSLLTIKEAAERMRVSPSLLYALCAAKKIRHRRIGLGRGKILIPVDAIEEFLQGRTVGVAEETPKPPPPPRPSFKHLSLS